MKRQWVRLVQLDGYFGVTGSLALVDCGISEVTHPTVGAIGRIVAIDEGGRDEPDLITVKFLPPWSCATIVQAFTPECLEALPDLTNPAEFEWWLSA